LRGLAGGGRRAGARSLKTFAVTGGDKNRSKNLDPGLGSLPDWGPWGKQLVKKSGDQEPFRKKPAGSELNETEGENPG